MILYGYRNGRTLRALWALEEVGVAYDYIEVDVMRGQGRAPWFLKINPAGKVPVLVDAGTIVSESAAVCMHIAEKFPESGLLPPPGTVQRTECYKWLSYILTELDAPLWTIAKHRFGLPAERRVAAVVDTAIWEFEVAVAVMASRLEHGPYLVEGSFTVADILAGHILLWAKSARLEINSDRLVSYLDVLMIRNAFGRAQERASVRPTLHR